MLRKLGYMIAFVALTANASWSASPGEIYRATLEPRDGTLRFCDEFVLPADLELRDKPLTPVRGVPKNAGRTRFGIIKLGNTPDSGVTILITGSGGGMPKLYADKNRNGSLADETSIEFQWINAYAASFAATAKYKDGKTVPTQVIVLLPNDPSVGTAIYATDTYRVGNIKLADGKMAAIALVDLESRTDYKDLSGIGLLVDPNGKGDFENVPDASDPYNIKEPFNIGGVTYEVAYVDPSGTQLALRVSKRTVPARPVLSVGAQLPDFSAVDVEGKDVSLADYRGKIVLLDFWATWCGPCVQEMPNVKKAYDQFHKDGFDIIGVSLDRTKIEMLDYTRQNGILWRQICDGKIADLYRIRKIPASFLLDKEGKIIARNLRGEQLIQAVEKAVKEIGKS